MDHEIVIALVSMAGGVIIALIAAFSAMMLARNTSKNAAHKKEVEELVRKTARRAEVAALKVKIETLEKENAVLKRRVNTTIRMLRSVNNNKKKEPKNE